MEGFETKVINTVACPPRLWRMYVDNAIVIQKTDHRTHFLQLNSMDPQIQFTTEEYTTDVSIPFLDTLVTLVPDNKLLTIVYRKPTHTDQYLNGDSNHNFSTKYSAYNNFTQRARNVCTYPPLMHKGKENRQGLFKGASFPIGDLESKTPTGKTTTTITTTKNNHNKDNDIHIVVPYIEG